MATYVNDLRLKEITTGDEAGTWGTSTNTNLELIGEALGYGTQNCFSSNANATTTVADGASDPARAMYFKVTSSATLTATRTLTIAPNTISRVMLIENATTGNQSIAISQGSGANVTIPNGQTKMVYLDGAGSGAAVVDVFNSFNGDTLELLNLSVGATVTAGGGTFSTVDINGGTIDGATIGGASAGAGTFTTLSATSGLSLANDVKATFGTSTELEIYYNSSATVNLIDSPSASIQMGASSIQLGSYGGSAYALFDNTGVDVTGTVTADGLTVDTSTLHVDALNNRVGVGTASPSYHLDVYRDSDDNSPTLALRNPNAGASAASRVYMESNGNNFNIYNYGDGTSTPNKTQFISTAGGSYFTFDTANSEAMRITSAGNVGIGESSPGAKLEVFRTGTFGVAYQPAVYITNNSSGGTSTANTGLGAIAWATDSNATVTCSIEGIRENPSVGASSGLAFRTGSSSGGTERMRIDASGNLLVGDTTYRLSDIAATGQAIQLGARTFIGTEPSGDTVLGGLSGSTFTAFYQGGSERMRIDSSGDVGIGTSSPSGRLSVDTTGAITTNLNSTNASGGYVRWQNSGTSIGDIGAGAQTFSGGTAGDFGVTSRSGNLVLGTGSTERARIDSSGNLFVGVTSQQGGGAHCIQAGTGVNALQIQNNGAAPYGPYINFSAATPNNTVNYFMLCEDATATRAILRANGGFVNYQSNDVDLSDERTKKDITPAPSYWDKIGALEIVTYKYNDQSHDDVNVGVIAQQVETVEPVWVDNDGFGETPEGEEPLKTVYTKDIIFAAIKALQEAMARIETLEAEVAALKGA